MATNDDGNGPGIDDSLRERVLEQMGSVRDALEAASAHPSDQTLDELYHATDRLMRALGRVILEIERRRGLRGPGH